MLLCAQTCIYALRAANMQHLHLHTDLHTIKSPSFIALLHLTDETRVTNPRHLVPCRKQFTCALRGKHQLPHKGRPCPSTAVRCARLLSRNPAPPDNHIQTNNTHTLPRPLRPSRQRSVTVRRPTKQNLSHPLTRLLLAKTNTHRSAGQAAKRTPCSSHPVWSHSPITHLLSLPPPPCVL